MGGADIGCHRLTLGELGVASTLVSVSDESEPCAAEDCEAYWGARARFLPDKVRSGVTAWGALVVGDVRAGELSVVAWLTAGGADDASAEAGPAEAATDAWLAELACAGISSCVSWCTSLQAMACTL